MPQEFKVQNTPFIVFLIENEPRLDKQGGGGKGSSPLMENIKQRMGENVTQMVGHVLFCCMCLHNLNIYS